MRRLILLILALLLAMPFAAAEELCQVETPLFTINLPASLDPDLDVYAREDYSFLRHLLKPIIIQGENEQYSLLISLYDFPSDERHRVDASVNPAHGLFEMICGYYGHSIKGRTARPEGDYRDFVLGSDPARGYFLLTLYNQTRGEGYVFEMRVKNGSLTTADAEAQLLAIAASLREAGVIYPQATGSTLIVTHVGVNVRSGPSQNSAVLCVAKQGQTFPFLGENGIWYMIDVDGKIGYVSKALTMVQE